MHWIYSIWEPNITFILCYVNIFFRSGAPLCLTFPVSETNQFTTGRTWLIFLKPLNRSPLNFVCKFLMCKFSKNKFWPLGSNSDIQSIVFVKILNVLEIITIDLRGHIENFNFFLNNSLWPPRSNLTKC